MTRSHRYLKYLWRTLLSQRREKITLTKTISLCWLQISIAYCLATIPTWVLSKSQVEIFQMRLGKKGNHHTRYIWDLLENIFVYWSMRILLKLFRSLRTNRTRSCWVMLSMWESDTLMWMRLSHYMNKTHRIQH